MSQMNLDKTFAIYTSLLSKKYGRSSESLEQNDIRNKDVNIEYEVRFNDINKMKFEEIHKKLLMSGFILQNEEYYLKISNYINSIRCEITDLTHVKNFCKTNILPDTTTYLIKEKFREYPDMFNNNDYNFRVSMQKEISLKDADLTVKQLLKAWSSADKSYRYMNRVTLIHPNMPGVVVDLSVVKSAKKQDRLLKEKEFGVSKLFEMPESYEIEVELKPTIDKDSLSKPGLMKLLDDLKKTIKYICSGFQSSNFPISGREQHVIGHEYYSLFSKIEIDRYMPTSNMFIGPSSYTLQKINMVDDPGNTAPCILRDFCVTDKADGDRKMLFIAGNGRIYLITSNMKVQYSGAVCRDKELLGLLIDGEHILYDKKKKYINLYAAFDVYYVGGRSVRLLPFILEKGQSRYKFLQDKIEKLNEVIEYLTKEQMQIKVKKFAVSTEDLTIQQCCESLFATMDTYPYNTDGLIFTSKSLGVGIEEVGDNKVKNYKYTWKHSFKWKPPEYNTIDFLVKVKKTYGDKDEVKNIFSPETQNVEEFKILNLYVGWDESTHGISNPQDTLFRGDIPTLHSEKKGLTPQLFMPSSPYDENAHITYLPLKNDTSGGTQHMYTEEEETIETDTIVEFKYEFNENVFMRWKPLRVRYDKTAEYKNTNSIFGNAFHVANSNWQTIHNPITKEMLIDRELKMTMDDIDDKDVYYNKATGPSKTVNLRDFHNMYVKHLLINAVSNETTTLVDFAVGKAGDLQKWIHARVKFVLGIDISKDNIHNKKDGACARYIGIKQKNKQIPDALFIQGDSSKMIINALTTDDPLVEEVEEDKKSKFVLKQVMGIGKADEKHGKYLAKQFGVAKQFDVGSIQFAIHYMFENKYTLHNFLKNVSDFIKPGGYFIGTCYDGAKIFDLLNDVEENESKDIFVGSKKIWSVIKKYDNTHFPETLGLKIGVYQETINKVFDEYLVDFRYLIQLLERYGFTLDSPLKEIGPIGDFSTLYKKMQKDKDKKITMTEEESQISFLNNYFIFRKMHNVDTDQVHRFYTQDEEDTKSKSISVPVRLNKKIILKGKS
jgi:SAM-dependent methyltransferase